MTNQEAAESQRAPSEDPAGAEIPEGLMYDAMSAMECALPGPFKTGGVVDQCDDYINDCMADAMVNRYTLAITDPKEFERIAAECAERLMKEFIQENWAAVVEHFQIGMEDEE